MLRNQIIFLFLFTICLPAYRTFAQEKMLSLEEVKSLALENNKNLKRTQQDVEAALAAKASADATGKPTLDGSLSGLYFTEPLSAFLPEVVGSASLSVSQVVYAGGKVQNGKKLSTAALGVQNARKALAEDEVLLRTETAYWQLVNAKEKVVLANKYIQMLDELHGDLQNAYDAGLTYKNDLLKVSVQQNEAQFNLTRAHDGVTMAKLTLAQLTGLEDIGFDVLDDVIGSFDAVLGTEHASAVMRRPEIAMLEKAVEINELQGKLLDGDRKPTVALSGTGFAALGKNADPVSGNNDVEGFVGMVSVNIPLFDWGSRKQKVREQRFKTEGQKLELEEAKEQMRLEIKSTLLDLNQASKRIELAQKSLQQADENLRLNKDRFDAGTVIGEDVLEAQVLWEQAYADIIDAKAVYKISEAKYRKAIGEY